jgi:hypothetical protein
MNILKQYMMKKQIIMLAALFLVQVTCVQAQNVNNNNNVNNNTNVNTNINNNNNNNINVSVNGNGIQSGKFGFRVGIVGASVSYSESDADLKSKSGYLGGITLDKHITRSAFVFTALDLVQKGYKTEYEDYEHTVTTTCNPLYAQFSLHLGGKIDVGIAALALHAGPYAAYALGGKYTTRYSGSSDKESYDIWDKDNGSNYKRFDYGLGAAAGLELSVLALDFGFDYGLNNLICKCKEESAHNFTVYVTLGLKF